MRTIARETDEPLRWNCSMEVVGEVSICDFDEEGYVQLETFWQKLAAGSQEGCY